MYTVKKILEKDLPDLASLYDDLSGATTNKHKMKRVFNQLINNSHYFLLGAYDSGNKLVGTIMGLLCLDLVMECQPIMIMENMVVDSRCRGQGVGKKLLSELENIAKEKNCFFIQYCSSMYRKEAHAFYESMGYDPDMVKGYRKFF